jgi:hypothetical protein
MLLSTQIGLKGLMTPVSCPWHTQNRVNLFLLCRMQMTKTCYIQFLAKMVYLKVRINEYLLIFAYTAFKLFKSLFKRKEAISS